MPKPLAPLYKELGITPKNEALFEQAFTHPSYNAVGKGGDYERLEFLGDSLVGFVVSDLCYRYHGKMEEGDLSILKSHFIKTEAEAEYAREMGLSSYIRMGPSFQSDINEAYSVLEDVFESFIGALYLDQGLAYTIGFLRKLLEERVKKAEIAPKENPKSLLQEAMQADRKASVTYKVLESKGPSHRPEFLVAVYFEDSELGRGKGHSKKEAETAAAKDALEKMAG